MDKTDRKQKRTWFGVNAYEDITMWKPEPLDIKPGAGEDWFLKEWHDAMEGDDYKEAPTPDKLFLIHWDTKDIEEMVG
jgi:hypothetical protein